MKKKIFLITLAACLLVLTIAGSSYAYFTDTDKKATTFTAGNVDITLTYNGPADDANFFPGQKYTNINASITNVGSEDAYVGAIIELSKEDLNTILTAEGGTKNIPAAIAKVFNGIDAKNENTVVNTVKYVETDGVCKIFVVVEAKQTTNDTANIFESVAIPAEWDNAQMATFNNMGVTVTAYATQTVGFNNAAQALTTAFTDWAGYNNA